jgi:hypothetical protein
MNSLVKNLPTIVDASRTNETKKLLYVAGLLVYTGF